MPATQAPYSQYFDKNGQPLDAGYVWFGLPNENPKTSPVNVYWDADLTQPALQPIRTLAGYLARNGSPAQVFTDGAYSQIVENKRFEMVYYAANSADYSDLPIRVAVITATDGQTLVNLPFAYTRGNNSLAIYLNGILLIKDKDYTETSTTSVTMIRPLKVGPGGADEVTAIGGRLINAASAIDAVSAAALASSSGAGLVGYSPALTFPAGTVGARLQVLVSVKDFGAVGDGVTDDYAACNAALAYVISKGGGTVYFPQGEYLLSATLGQGNALVPIHYQGAGMSFQGQAGIGTILKATHTSGAVLQRSYFGGSVKDMTIDANSTRAASSFVELNCGILDLNSNQALDQSMQWEIAQVQVRNQPGDGIISCNFWKAAEIHHCRITDNKGHGVRLCRASDLGLPYTTFESRAGGLSVRQNLIFRNGGHAVYTGAYPLGNSTYRVNIEDNDIAFCATDAAVRVTNHVLLIYSENAEIHRNGIGGYTGSFVAANIGILAAATAPQITCNRFIACLGSGVELVSAADGALVAENQVDQAGAAALNPLVLVGAGTSGVLVRQGVLTDITTVMTPAPSGSGNRAVVSGIEQQGLRSRSTAITLATGTASAAIPVSAAGTFGIVALSSSSSTGTPALFAFRTGDAFSYSRNLTTGTVLAASAVPPTGTTGTAGQLNVIAMTNANAIYIENRTAGTVAVMTAFLSLSTGELA